MTVAVDFKNVDIVFGSDANGAQMGLRTHHMLHRGNEFLGQAAMGNKNNANHAGSFARRDSNKNTRRRKGYLVIKVP